MKKREIIELSIDDIKPYDGSHRFEAAIPALADSLKKFGLQQPVIVDKDHVIVAGNGIYFAAVKLGWKSLECIVLDNLTDEQIAQYRIADNKTSEFAKWNEAKLKKEVSCLQDPNELQFCFDESLLSLIGANTQPKEEKQPQKAKKADGEDNSASNDGKSTEKVEKSADNDFKENIKATEKSMQAEPVQYMEYTCSACGKTVRFKL